MSEKINNACKAARRNNPLIFLTALGALMLASTKIAASAPASGTATGNLIVDGKAIPLKFAYVIDVDNVEEAGLKFPTTQHYRVIVLSDRELPAASVCDRNAPASERVSPMQIMEPTGKIPSDKIYGIRLLIDPKQANPLSAEFLYPNKDPMTFTVMGTEYTDRVTNVKVVGRSVSGQAELSRITETRLGKGPKKYSYLVTFHAPITTEPAITSNLTGKEALDSAPVAALRAHLIAGKTGDLDALRKLTAESHSPYLKHKELLENLKGGEIEKIAEQVKRVIIRGSHASVVCVNEEPNYSQVMIHLIEDKEGWKMQWP